MVAAVGEGSLRIKGPHPEKNIVPTGNWFILGKFLARRPFL